MTIGIVKDGNKTLCGQSDADGIAYDNTTSGMTADNMQDAVDELNANLNKGSVSVQANGVKTVAQLLNELATLIDFSKIRHTSMVEIIYTDGFHAVYKLYTYHHTNEIFVENSRTSSNYISSSLYIKANASFSRGMGIAANGTINFADDSSTVPTNGTIYKVIY